MADTEQLPKAARSRLVSIIDALATTRDFVTITYEASSALPEHQAHAFSTTLVHAESELNRVTADLYRLINEDGPDEGEA